VKAVSMWSVGDEWKVAGNAIISRWSSPESGGRWSR